MNIIVAFAFAPLYALSTAEDFTVKKVSIKELEEKLER